MQSADIIIEIDHQHRTTMQYSELNQIDMCRLIHSLISLIYHSLSHSLYQLLFHIYIYLYILHIYTYYINIHARYIYVPFANDTFRMA